MGDVVVGTCSWTDKTMSEAYYPQGVSSAEARLRYYAARFDTVEVDSTFYGLPRKDYARAWADRTPPGFVFHVKAFGMMTQHEVDERALHPELREHGYEVSPRGRVQRPSAEMVAHSFEIFLRELEPLREAGKMGGVLMQFPPYFTALDPERTIANLGYIEWAREQLAEERMLVEFRHPSWVEGRQLPQTLAFLAERDITFVAVDSPQFETGGAVQPLTAVTAPWAYVRFHGRNREMWHARTQSAADRFDYLYREAELQEWRESLRNLAEDTERTWVMFNNCKYDYAPRNAAEMASILGDVVAPRRWDVPTGEPAGEPPSRRDDGQLELRL
jgi:uncharacterized protein YecE (DUF72 family)